MAPIRASRETPRGRVLRSWVSSRATALAMLAVLLAAGSPGVARAAEVDEGQHAYAAGQFETARRLWERAAEAGDPGAQLGLASLYDLGQGGPREAASAYRWYLRAAEAGVAAAEFNVAVMRDTGDGIARDTADAALWYARAAAHGNRRAQYNLGQLYAAGEGVPRNLGQAEMWFRDAATDLPAAAKKLVATRRSEGDSRARLSAAVSVASESPGPLVPVQPVAPANGSTVPALAGAPGGADAVELVWVAPAQVVPVQFFVQVLALDAAGPREVFATYLDETAALAPLDRVPGRYAWRVYAVGRDLKHYAASEWVRFAVRAPE